MRSWAHRVETLGAGVTGTASRELNVDGLASALRECLRSELSAGAQALASRIELRGARRAAERLTGLMLEKQ